MKLRRTLSVVSAAVWMSACAHRTETHRADAENGAKAAPAAAIGSYLPGGAAPASSPVQVIDQQDIETSGAASLSEALKKRVPSLH